MFVDEDSRKFGVNESACNYIWTSLQISRSQLFGDLHSFLNLGCDLVLNGINILSMYMGSAIVRHSSLLELEKKFDAMT